MNRKQFISEQLNINGKGLEIGPGYNPIFPKKEGYNVKTLDHASGETLRKKYSSDQNVDISKIEDVDFVWNGEPYIELIGKEKFDWVFASHVAEHTPDLVSFIIDCTSVLKPDGSLILIIPDKRYTFDVFRPQSNIGSIIDAHIEQRKMPSLGAKIDGLFYYGLKKDRISLYDKIIYPYAPSVDISQLLNRNTHNKIYHDVHVWAFTPSHFRLIIEILFNARMINLREKYFHSSVGIEFFIVLSATGKGPSVPIDCLIKKAMKESRSFWPWAGRGTRWPISLIFMLDRRFLGGSLRKVYQKYKLLKI